MTNARWNALIEFWNENPPVDMQVAAYFRAMSKSPRGKADSRGLPNVSRPNGKDRSQRIRGGDGPTLDPMGNPIPKGQTIPTLAEKPGTMSDLARMLKASGRNKVSLSSL